MVLPIELFVLIWYLLFPGTAATASMFPSPYPESFSVTFVSNITRDEMLPAGSTITGTLFYDWANHQAQRVDHGKGSYECQHFYQHEQACSLLFLPDGLYRILHYSEDPDNQTDCCLDLAELGPPPPDWQSKANPTYKGIVTDDFSNLKAHEWIFDHVQLSNYGSEDAPADKFHTSRQVASGDHAGEPLLFTFPSVNGRQDYHYIPETMVIGPQDSQHFTLPFGCMSRVCSKQVHAEALL